MSEGEKSPRNEPTPPRTPAEPASPDAATPTLTNIVTQITVRALKEYAETEPADLRVAPRTPKKSVVRGLADAQVFDQLAARKRLSSADRARKFQRERDVVSPKDDDGEEPSVASRHDTEASVRTVGSKPQSPVGDRGPGTPVPGTPPPEGGSLPGTLDEARGSLPSSGSHPESGQRTPPDSGGKTPSDGRARSPSRTKSPSRSRSRSVSPSPIRSDRVSPKRSSEKKPGVRDSPRITSPSRPDTRASATSRPKSLREQRAESRVESRASARVREVSSKPTTPTRTPSPRRSITHVRSAMDGVDGARAKTPSGEEREVKDEGEALAPRSPTSGPASKASLSGGVPSGRASPRRGSATPSRLSGRSPAPGSDQAFGGGSSFTDGRQGGDGKPPPKPKKKTQIDESSSSESEEESVESVDSSSDDGGEMVVLDPDHPLMTRFQNALNRHLVKQINKVNLEVNELQFQLKSKQREREDVGVDLYGIQQELARNQMSVEQLHDEFAKRQKERIQGEQELREIREAYTEKHKLIKMERKKAADLLAEVENLALRLYYMESAKNDVRSDIAVMKRAAEKAEMEVAKSEMEKQKQDIYVNRLVERVDKLQETIAMYDAQITAQREETKAAEDTLAEARMEIEAITLEKKQLFHQWNCSLIGMRRRDEARAAMQEALDQEHQRIISMETEIEGYKRSTQKEQEQNEKLTMILNKAENDIATIRKQMVQCQTKLDGLKNEYATYTRMMHETEHSLNKANADKAMWATEQTAVRKQLEQQYAEKVKLEDDILQKMHDQLTIDKAAKYTFKLVKQLRQKTKATATNIARIENDISNNTLEGSNLLARIERLTETIQEYEEEIKLKNEIVTRCINETVKRNATIERKQGVIDQLNKKIDLMLSQSGGVELGPLEVTINSLQKSIMAEHEETTELQNMWLRNQHELVQLTKEQDSQQCDINNIKKQLTILQQKKLRTEGEIEMEKAEALEQERDIGTVEKEMMKLNMLLYKKRGLHHELEQSNSLMESDFIGSLKEAERESIELQEQLNGLQEEKERLLNSLVEAERQIMLWEKKTQLARETRAAVDSDIGEGEIKAMKAEIHRMQVRHGQLLKTQERMIQDMEKAVSRRDTIVTRGEARAKLNQKVVTKGKFQRQLTDLRKKIKNAIAEANSCDDEIETLRSDQSEMSQQLEEKQLEVQEQQGMADMLDGDIEQRMEEKQKNLLNLVQRQQKAKFYQQIKDGKYVRVCRTDSARQTERTRQEERMQSILAIVDRLSTDLPNLQPALQRVSYVYGSGASGSSQDSLVSAH